MSETYSFWRSETPTILAAGYPLVTRWPAIQPKSQQYLGKAHFGHLIGDQGTLFAAGFRARRPAYHRFGRILREGQRRLLH